MGKGNSMPTTKKAAHGVALKEVPNFSPPPTTYREKKRKTIVAGLRVMRAPAETWHEHPISGCNDC